MRTNPVAPFGPRGYMNHLRRSPKVRARFTRKIRKAERVAVRTFGPTTEPLSRVLRYI